MAAGPEILIAGGGIGGLSAALALARAGRRVRVLEKAAEFEEIGYGIQMGPNVHPMLERLGVAAAIAPHAVYPEALVLADGLTGRELTRISLGAAFLARYRYRYFVIHRRDLHGALLKGCRDLTEIALEASKGIVRFDDRGDRVVVFCEDGSEYEGAALIGADGLWSPTRAALIGDGPPAHGRSFLLSRSGADGEHRRPRPPGLDDHPRRSTPPPRAIPAARRLGHEQRRDDREPALRAR
jgi:salicylate hydroxylase